MMATLIAQAAASGGNEMLNFGFTIVLVIVMFYFVAIRPGNQQRKALKALQDGLKPGDKVVTGGGIYGIIREVQENTVKMEIAPNTVIKIATASITTAVGKDGQAQETK